METMGRQQMTSSLLSTKKIICAAHKKTGLSTKTHPVTEKVFNDNVHGHMRIPALCVSVMDTPEFQRLRWIKQVGPTYLVYPGASHNRFEHSLGVCHLAGEMIDHLRHAAAERSRAAGSNHGLEGSQPEITDRDKLCVQLAGLCHDLGHGPLSHTWEHFANAVRRTKGLSPWKHEDSSLTMLDRLIERNQLMPEFERNGLGAEDVAFVKELIVGRRWDQDDQPKHFLFQVVSNKDNEIDVDKFDYILRDGKHLNMPDAFDCHRLMASCRLVRVPEAGNKWHICYRDKDDLNILNMFQARARLHYQSYQHPVSKCLETMLLDVLTLADANGFVVPLPDGTSLPLSESMDNLDAWFRVTDNVLWDIQLSFSRELALAKQLLNRVVSRDLYTLLAVSRCQTPDSLKEKQAAVAALWSRRDEKGELRFSELRLNFGSSGSDPFQRVFFYGKRGGTAASKPAGNVPLFPTTSLGMLRTDLFIFTTRSKSEVTAELCQEIQQLVQ